MSGGRAVWRWLPRFAGLMVFLGLVAEGVAAEAEPVRHALVIGNQSYAYRPVPSALHDAAKMAESLSELGFRVTLLKNATRGEMEKGIQDFIARVRDGEAALVYYSGHGVQYAAENYLIPVKAVIQRAEEIPSQSIAVRALFQGIRRQGPNIVLLDACRDPPFPDAVASAILPGLADNAALPRDTVIGFAASPGRRAVLGAVENHSPYTRALLRYIRTPGVRLADILMRVRIRVEENTSGRQTPWENGSPRAHFFFRPAASATFRIDHADDDVMVLVNGAIVASEQKDAGAPRTVELAAGPNPFSLLVYNERTFGNGVELFGGRQPQGWGYQVTVLTSQGVSRTFSGREERPTRDGPRHGKLFEVVSGILYVDEQKGHVSIENLGEHRWEH